MAKWAARTILVVEHDSLQRGGAAVMLEDAGFLVCEAASVSDAMAMIQASPDQYSLVLSDVNMPGSMNGLEFADAVSRQWPSIAIVLVSGAYDLLAKDMPKGSRFFSKPFFSDHVVTAVSELTDAIGRR